MHAVAKNMPVTTHIGITHILALFPHYQYGVSYQLILNSFNWQSPISLNLISQIGDTVVAFIFIPFLLKIHPNHPWMSKSCTGLYGFPIYTEIGVMAF